MAVLVITAVRGVLRRISTSDGVCLQVSSVHARPSGGGTVHRAALSAARKNSPSLALRFFLRFGLKKSPQLRLRRPSHFKELDQLHQPFAGTAAAIKLE